MGAPWAAPPSGPAPRASAAREPAAWGRLLSRGICLQGLEREPRDRQLPAPSPGPTDGVSESALRAARCALSGRGRRKAFPGVHPGCLSRGPHSPGFPRPKQNQRFLLSKHSRSQTSQKSQPRTLNKRKESCSEFG